MQQNSMTDIDFTVLSKPQLVALVLARGDALMAYIAADQALHERIATGRLTFEDMVQMETTKEAALLKLGEVETTIMFDPPAASTAN